MFEARSKDNQFKDPSSHTKYKNKVEIVAITILRDFPTCDTIIVQ